MLDADLFPNPRLHHHDLSKQLFLIRCGIRGSGLDFGMWANVP